MMSFFVQKYFLVKDVATIVPNYSVSRKLGCPGIHFKPRCQPGPLVHAEFPSVFHNRQERSDPKGKRARVIHQEMKIFPGSVEISATWIGKSYIEVRESLTGIGLPAMLGM